MKNNCFFVLLFVPFFLFGNEWVFSLKDSLYYESDMYAFYGLSEWKRSSGEKKKKMVEDFIVREGAYFFGKVKKLRWPYLDTYKVGTKKKLSGFGRGAAPRAQIRGVFLCSHLFTEISRCEDLFTAEQVIHLMGA